MHSARLPKVPRRFMHICLCAVLWLISSAPFGGQTGDSPPYRVVVPDSTSGRILRPAETALLNVRVTGATGAPVSGAKVWFVAPHTGSAGTFAAGYQGQNTLVQATTDAGGMASTSFTAGSREGVFTLDVLVDASSAAATFAITVRSAAAQPALSASAVRAALVQGLLAGVAESETTHLLHGPFLLPAKTLLYSGGPESPISRTQPFATEVESWLFWIDDSPLAGFAHYVRWVLLPASATSVTDADVLTQSWWPIARFPGTTNSDSLAQPGGSSPFLQFSNWSPVRRTTSAAPRTRLAEQPISACAVLAHGPGLRGAGSDIVRLRDQLADQKVVPISNILMNTVDANLNFDPNGQFLAPVTRSRLRGLIDNVSPMPCDRVYFGYSGFGAPADSERNGGLLLAPEDTTDSGFLSYEDLVETLAPLRGKELLALTFGSYSGQLAPWLQGRGFTGEVATSADANSVSWSAGNGGGSSYGMEFALALWTPTADTNGDGQVTYSEAHQYVVKTSSNPYATKSNPLASPISATGTRWSRVPSGYISSTGTHRYAWIWRPRSVPQDRVYQVRLRSHDRSIGEFVPHDTPVPMAPGQNWARFRVQGNAYGVFDYTLEGTDVAAGQQYTGQGRFQVGHFDSTPYQGTLQLPPTGTASTSVALTRYGWYVRNPKNNATTIYVSSANGSIAGVGPSGGTETQVFMPHGQTQATFPIVVRQPGWTYLRISDGISRYRRVIIIRALPRPTASAPVCPTAGSFSAAFGVKSDAGLHQSYINMPSSTMLHWQLLQNNTRIRLWGYLPQIVPAEGPFHYPTCTGVATGFSTGPIAGFSNVQGEYLNFTVALPGGSQSPAAFSRMAGAAPLAADAPVTFDYRLGGLGEFPGGQPIVYSGSGQVDAGGCSYQLFPERTLFPSDGGSTAVWVSTTAGCDWTVTSSAAWLTVATPASGKGVGSVTISVEASQATAKRSATVGIGQTTTLIEQSAAAGDSPVIFSRGVVNAGSFMTGFSSGSWLAVFGTGLSSTARAWTGADFAGGRLPAALDGVSVSINGKPGFLSYVSPGQVNVLADEDPAEGPVELVVTSSRGSSETYWAYKRSYEPEFFRFAPEDGRFVAGVHLDGIYLGRPGLIPGADTRAAKPNDIVMLFGTGFGQTDPATDHSRLVSQAAVLRLPALIRIGGTVVEVVWAGIVAPGLYQFNVRIPNLPAGDHLVEAFVQGYPLQDQAYITVQP